MYHTIRSFLIDWGYWAIVLGLMGECAGLPLPGETVLMFASFLAHKHTGLKIQWVILSGTLASVTGDNLGFLIGRKLGNRLVRWMKKLFHMDDEDVAAAKDQVQRRGAITVFFARYIFGLRTINGPLAGMLEMRWTKFLLYNFLGGASWVTAMALTGYLFANEFETLLGYIEKGSWILAGGLFGLGYFLWHRQKEHFKQRQEQKHAA